jgi:Lrp/AsnC family leucine-responsive transcriptional regulator
VLDETDLKIIACLQNNARSEWKEVGQKVHMTGQAVAARVRKLEEQDIIEGYSLRLNQTKIGNSITALITVFMKTTAHDKFQNFIKTKAMIVETHRISGEGCYWLKAVASSHDELNKLLDEILVYGNYRSNISIAKIK